MHEGSAFEPPLAPIGRMTYAAWEASLWRRPLILSPFMRPSSPPAKDRDHPTRTNVAFISDFRKQLSPGAEISRSTRAIRDARTFGAREAGAASDPGYVKRAPDNAGGFPAANGAKLSLSGPAPSVGDR